MPINQYTDEHKVWNIITQMAIIGSFKQIKNKHMIYITHQKFRLPY